MLLQDVNGVGETSDASKTFVFFDGAKVRGLNTPTTNISSVQQSTDRSVGKGDGTMESIYRLLGLNGDGTNKGEIIKFQQLIAQGCPGGAGRRIRLTVRNPAPMQAAALSAFGGLQPMREVCSGVLVFP